MIVTVVIIASPRDHLSARPYGCVKDPANWRIRCAGRCPTIRLGIISPAGVLKAAAGLSAPDNHFTASPHRCVKIPAIRRVGGAGGCPAVGRRIISPAGIQEAGVATAPDNHFSAGPDCGV